MIAGNTNKQPCVLAIVSDCNLGDLWRFEDKGSNPEKDKEGRRDDTYCSVFRIVVILCQVSDFVGVEVSGARGFVHYSAINFQLCLLIWYDRIFLFICGKLGISLKISRLLVQPCPTDQWKPRDISLALPERASAIVMSTWKPCRETP